MRVIDQYVLEGELGRGGMGVVYRARDQIIGREVAVKSVRVTGEGTARETAGFREALLREAKAAGQLSHSNIVAIHHVIAGPDELFIVMELVDGGTLAEELSGLEEPALLSRTLDLLAQAALALDYAHGRGVVHRDVKPSNFIVRRDGVLKLTDFGISKILGSTSATATTKLVGTPHYMSPEQVLGQKVDGRSDQFSLAVIAWELLAGNQPFSGDSEMSLLYNIVHSTPDPAACLPAKARRVLEKALSKSPQDRFPACSDFVSSLREATGKPLEGHPRPATSRRARVLWIAALAAAATASAVFILPRFVFRSAPGLTSEVPASRAAPPVSQTTASPAGQSSLKHDLLAREKVGKRAEPQRESSNLSNPTRRFVPPSVAAPGGSPQIPESPPVNATPGQDKKIDLPAALVKAAAPEPSQPGGPVQKPEGTLVWRGALESGQTVSIDGGRAVPGAATGPPLPGVSVQVDVSPGLVKVVQQPAAGAWNHLVLENTGRNRVDEIRIHWRVVR